MGKIILFFFFGFGVYRSYLTLGSKKAKKRGKPVICNASRVQEILYNNNDNLPSIFPHSGAYERYYSGTLFSDKLMNLPKDILMIF